jgi:hypothetical protein
MFPVSESILKIWAFHRTERHMSHGPRTVSPMPRAPCSPNGLVNSWIAKASVSSASILAVRLSLPFHILCRKTNFTSCQLWLAETLPSRFHGNGQGVGKTWLYVTRLSPTRELILIFEQLLWMRMETNLTCNRGQLDRKEQRLSSQEWLILQSQVSTN